MFELPEILTLSRQVNQTLIGKTIASGSLGNSPHKFVWYNQTPQEFSRLTAGKQVGTSYGRGKWLFIPLEPGYRLVVGECGGKFLHHPAGASLPAKYHLLLAFSDGSFLSAMTQMWGAYELYLAGEELKRQYIQGMRIVPLDAEFTFEYFSQLIDEQNRTEKRSLKGLLTQEGLLPGLGNAITQDILFRAGMHPRRPLSELDTRQRQTLYQAVLETLQQAVALGGRNDETDLFGQPGGYQRLMHNGAVGQPCPACATPIQKIQYLGGACYFCPRCQI
jgi:formamidopyrimidine-DNA glycosylase